MISQYGKRIAAAISRAKVSRRNAPAFFMPTLWRPECERVMILPRQIDHKGLLR
jgi:hypothetical protein